MDKGDVQCRKRLKGRLVLRPPPIRCAIDTGGDAVHFRQVEEGRKQVGALGPATWN